MFRRLVASLLAFAALGAASSLVEDGNPRATIVIASDATPAERDAGIELAHYVERATGARLPRSGSGFRVHVGGCAKERLARMGPDAYVVVTTSTNDLCLAGNPPDGPLFAVYEFLERVAGVRWLWPGELGEIVPRRRTLTVDRLSIAAEPAWRWRDLGPGGALWGPLDKWAAERKLGVSEAHQRQQRLWERHNRFGGERIYGGHAFGEILPPAKYGPTHPQYFALVNGKRGWEHFDGKHGAQPCTSNPEVVRLTIEYARRFFDQHPDYAAFAISLNDGRGFCECGNCRRLDSGRTQVQPGDPEQGRTGRIAVITDRIITFANAVAEQVSATNPSKKLILFAYSAYKEPPLRVKPHPNLIIQYTFQSNRNWDPAAERKQLEETAAWSGAVKHFAIYEYYVQGNAPDLPRVMVEPIARSVRELYRQGARYFQTQAGNGYALNGLNYYVLGRLLWNPEADVRAIVEDYVSTGFPAARAPVKRYFERLENQWREAGKTPVFMNEPSLASYRNVARAYPREFRGACARDLAEAAQLAEGVERQRVEFLRKGYEYVELTLGAIEKTIPLLEAGWDLRKMVAPSHPDMRQFNAALNAWARRDRFIEDAKHDFAIAYLWVRYNDSQRTFVPLARMRKFRASVTGQATTAEPVSRSIRQSIRETLFVPDPLPALHAKVHGSFEPEPGIVAERVTYATQYGMRVPAILYRRRNARAAAPAIIIVNGHGGDKYSWYAFYSGVLYARAGAVVLTYDPVGEGERNVQRKSGTRAHDNLPRNRMLGQHVGGLMMTDVMQAVSYLRSRKDVDPGRIAAAGYSMGSFVLSLACATEPRLRACVLVGGGNLDGPGEYWDTSKPMCQAYPYQALDFLGDRAAALYRLHAERGPTLILNGLKDNIMQPQRRDPVAFFRDLQERVGAPGRVFDTAYVKDGGHRPYFLTRGAALWLERQLDLPEWDEDGIRSMPETHILAWAKEHNVQMDRLYATELSEGGTRALAIGVPALTREQLSVLQGESWEPYKNYLILERWLERTQIHR